MNPRFRLFLRFARYPIRYTPDLSKISRRVYTGFRAHPWRVGLGGLAAGGALTGAEIAGLRRYVEPFLESRGFIPDRRKIYSLLGAGNILGTTGILSYLVGRSRELRELERQTQGVAQEAANAPRVRGLFGRIGQTIRRHPYRIGGAALGAAGLGGLSAYEYSRRHKKRKRR